MSATDHPNRAPSPSDVDRDGDTTSCVASTCYTYGNEIPAFRPSVPVRTPQRLPSGHNSGPDGVPVAGQLSTPRARAAAEAIDGHGSPLHDRDEGIDDHRVHASASSHEYEVSTCGAEPPSMSFGTSSGGAGVGFPSATFERVRSVTLGPNQSLTTPQTSYIAGAAPPTAGVLDLPPAESLSADPNGITSAHSDSSEGSALSRGGSSGLIVFQLRTDPAGFHGEAAPRESPSCSPAAAERESPWHLSLAVPAAAGSLPEGDDDDVGTLSSSSDDDDDDHDAATGTAYTYDYQHHDDDDPSACANSAVGCGAESDCLETGARSPPPGDGDEKFIRHGGGAAKGFRFRVAADDDGEDPPSDHSGEDGEANGDDDDDLTTSRASRRTAKSEESLDASLGGTSAARTATSATSMGTSAGCSLCGTRIKIPFTVLTLLAMAVPVTLLLVATLWPMAVAGEDLALVASFDGLSRQVSDCVSAMTYEDYTLHDTIYHHTAVSRVAYTDARAVTDAKCDVLLLTELRAIAARDAAFDSQRDQLAQTVRELAVQRALMDSAIDGGNITAQKDLLESMRPAMQAIIFRATNVIARVAAVVKSETSRFFVDLNLVGITRAKLWMAASTGNAYLSTATPTKEETLAFIDAASSAESASKSVEAAASPAVAQLMATWHTLNTTLVMFETMRGVLAVDRTQSLSVAQTTAFNAAMHAPLEGLRYIETQTVELISDAEASRNAVIGNAVLLTLGLILSLVATVLLARQQLKVQHAMETQKDRVEMTKRAVAAFVPRFFLNKMGYTSITHVACGDSREVALTMIFAVIHGFTNIAEGMNNRELFDWVQGYFKSMTTTIEGHHGNINQFIGDALFALFSTANDGVRCAVEMQAKTQQLSLQRLCVEGNQMPLDIGVGLHHDVLSLGILGDDKRHTCTAISASVNLASRLEGLTKHLGCNILASDAVVDQLGAQVRDTTNMRRVGPVQVKGSGSGVVVHDVFQSDARALQAYKRETRETFEKFTRLSLRPDSAIGPAETKRLTKLRMRLGAAAARHDVTDPSMARIAAARHPDTGMMVFGSK